MLQETWLQAGDLSISSEINEYNFKCLKSVRAEKIGGGRLVLFQLWLQLKSLQLNNISSQPKCFEYREL